MLRPRLAIEIGTYLASTTEAMARAIAANGSGEAARRRSLCNQGAPDRGWLAATAASGNPVLSAQLSGLFRPDAAARPACRSGVRRRQPRFRIRAVRYPERRPDDEPGRLHRDRQHRAARSISGRARFHGPGTFTGLARVRTIAAALRSLQPLRPRPHDHSQYRLLRAARTADGSNRRTAGLLRRTQLDQPRQRAPACSRRPGVRTPSRPICHPHLRETAAGTHCERAGRRRGRQPNHDPHPVPARSNQSPAATLLPTIDPQDHRSLARVRPVVGTVADALLAEVPPTATSTCGRRVQDPGRRPGYQAIAGEAAAVIAATRAAVLAYAGQVERPRGAVARCRSPVAAVLPRIGGLGRLASRVA